VQMYRSRMHPIHRWRRQNSMMINQIIINYPAAHLQPIAGLHHPRYNNIQQQLNLRYQERHRSIYYIQSLPPWRALFALPSWRRAYSVMRCRAHHLRNYSGVELVKIFVPTTISSGQLCCAQLCL
jgi:hypothetical protein